MKQLKELEIIESNIANKNKIIEQTNYNIEKGNSNINYLIISIIIAIILCGCVALYGYGKLDNKKFLTLVTIIAICYLCLFLYANNIFYLKDSMSYLFNARSIQSLENKLTTWQSRIETAAENNINEYKQTWIQNNCTCPIEEESISDDVYAIDPNSIVNEIPGYFYYDGSAPPQLLVPTPDPVQLSLDNEIDWVDYSSNGNVLYNATNNKTSYDNKNYYNYKNNKDPILKYEKKKNDFNSSQYANTSLVNDTTNSTNF
jgi:hypothetical protein